MFTGIVQGVAVVESLTLSEGVLHIALNFPADSLRNLKIGASISINGVCLTVVYTDQKSVARFDVIEQTLKLTNLEYLTQGESVNYERSLSFGDEIGGHLLSGHISCQAEVIEVVRNQDNTEVFFSLPEAFTKYLFSKGYIALNGCSLTVASLVGERFSVCFIPETLSVTTFANLQLGSLINVELDSQTQVIVDSLARMQERGAIKLST